MYKEVLTYFLRLGVFGFGGPLALISSMQKDLIDEREWMSQEEFNASFSLIKAMPGPVAFMTAVYLGRHRAGFIGGSLAGLGLVFPAFLLMIIFSLFFQSVSSLAFTRLLLLGMQMAAMGIILASLKNITRNYFGNWFFWVLVIISGYINFYRPGLEAFVILVFGFLSVLAMKIHHRLFELAALFWVCFKAGALVFGTGLAIVPMLEYDVVHSYSWLSQSEFLDALAFGQMTPGPVVITATYIGHKVHGLSGAIVATVSIFLASFFHMNTWFPKVVKKLGQKQWVNEFVFGAIAGVVGPIVVTVYKLAASLNPGWQEISLTLVAFILAFFNKLPIWAIIPLGGMVKMLMGFFE